MHPGREFGASFNPENELKLRPGYTKLAIRRLHKKFGYVKPLANLKEAVDHPTVISGLDKAKDSSAEHLKVPARETVEIAAMAARFIPEVWQKAHAWITQHPPGFG